MRREWARARGLVASIFLILALSGCAEVESGCSVSAAGHMDNVKTKMVMYDWLQEEHVTTSIYDDAIKEINNISDLQGSIDLRHIPGSPYYTKLNAAIAANDGPDLFTTHAAGVLRMYANANRLLPLDEVLDADPAWRASFKPGMFDYLTDNGHVYAIPTSYSVAALFYNN